MEDFGIKNYQITASSEDIFKKEWARFSDIGWCVSRELLSSVAPGQVLYHYLQIDLLVPHLIRGVVAQGAQIREALVTSFYVQYSFLGDEWFRYHTVCTLAFCYWFELTEIWATILLVFLARAATNCSARFWQLLVFKKDFFLHFEWSFAFWATFFCYNKLNLRT